MRLWPFRPIRRVREYFARLESKLDANWSRLETLTGRTYLMSQQLTDLTNAVNKTKGVVDSAVTLIGGLANQIRDLKDDPVALGNLATELDATANSLAAAVANTPTA